MKVKLLYIFVDRKKKAARSSSFPPKLNISFFPDCSVHLNKQFSYAVFNVICNYKTAKGANRLFCKFSLKI